MARVARCARCVKAVGLAAVVLTVRAFVPPASHPCAIGRVVRPTTTPRLTALPKTIREVPVPHNTSLDSFGQGVRLRATTLTPTHNLYPQGPALALALRLPANLTLTLTLALTLLTKPKPYH